MSQGQGLATEGIGSSPRFLLRPENFVVGGIYTGVATRFLFERMALKQKRLVMGGHVVKRPVCGAQGTKEWEQAQQESGLPREGMG